MGVIKPPIYTLPHGIEVIGEYPPRGKNRYWRLRVRPHPFFSGKVISDGLDVRRSRAVMSSVLGRALLPSEHVHHINEDRNNDSSDNLVVIGAAEHNRHHKTGAKHSEEARQKISAGLRLAIAEGRREPPPRPDLRGRTLSVETRRKISESHKLGLESGRIKKQTPPSPKGRKHSRETRDKQSRYASSRTREADGKFLSEVRRNTL